MTVFNIVFGMRRGTGTVNPNGSAGRIMEIPTQWVIKRGLFGSATPVPEAGPHPTETRGLTGSPRNGPALSRLSQAV